MEGANNTIRSIPDKGSSGRWQMVIAFVAGMALTAALAYSPAVVDALSTGPGQERIVPVPLESPYPLNTGGNLDNGNPAAPYINELVYTTVDDAELNC